MGGAAAVAEDGDHGGAAGLVHGHVEGGGAGAHALEGGDQGGRGGDEGGEGDGAHSGQEGVFSEFCFLQTYRLFGLFFRLLLYFDRKA